MDRWIPLCVLWLALNVGILGLKYLGYRRLEEEDKRMAESHDEEHESELRDWDRLFGRPVS